MADAARRVLAQDSSMDLEVMTTAVAASMVKHGDRYLARMRNQLRDQAAGK
jgi:hypothetical protein